MPPITRRPRGTPGWQFGLVAGGGLAGLIYIFGQKWDKWAKDKAENIAEKARLEKSLKDE